MISLNFNGMEKNPWFSYNAPMLIRLCQAVIYGDVLMRCIYRTHP